MKTEGEIKTSNGKEDAMAQAETSQRRNGDTPLGTRDELP
jgi:hypothetical protein